MEFFGAIYQQGSLNGSIEIIVKGPRNKYPMMVSRNLLDIGKPTKGPYFALHPYLEVKKFSGLVSIFKNVFVKIKKLFLNCGLGIISFLN